MPCAVVTGGRKGLGRALAVELASRGWRVFSFSRDARPGTEGGIQWFRGDVTDGASLREIAKQIAAQAKHIDLLINNAGAGGNGTTLPQVLPEEVQRQLDVHCIGALRCVQACIDLLLNAPSPVVVNITSRFGSTSDSATGGLNSADTSYSYRIAKAAQNMLTQCLLHDPALSRVAIVALNPGRLMTDSGARDADQLPAAAATAICDMLAAKSFRRGDMMHAFGGRGAW